MSETDRIDRRPSALQGIRVLEIGAAQDRLVGRVPLQQIDILKSGRLVGLGQIDVLQAIAHDDDRPLVLQDIGV